MYRFWDALTRPLLDQLKPDVIVEIGSDFGYNTVHLLEFARLTGAILHVVDPNPKFDIAEWEASYPENLRFHQAPSLDVLPSIGRADVVLIDGDHNWHTVFHELKALETPVEGSPSRYPVVLLHDIGWPYGRRDLYYEPDRIPAPHLQPYSKGGLRPGRDDLDPAGGLNAHLFNAVRAGGPRNGVLTAVEDFVREAGVEMQFLRIPGINDYGILYPIDIASRNKAFAEFVGELARPSALHQLLTDIEALRIESQISAADQQRDLDRQQRHLGRQQEQLDEMAKEAAVLNDDVDRANEVIQNLQRSVIQEKHAVTEMTVQFETATAKARRSEAALQTSIESYRTLLRNHQRLRKRRSVRIALGLARLVRPLFRLRRRKKGSQLHPRPAGVRQPGQAFQPDTETHGADLIHDVRADLTLEVSLSNADDLSAGPQPVTIIVPIYNAFDETKRCIEALVRNTQYPARLLLIDDASSDPRIAELLEDTRQRLDNVDILQNEVNLGFVATANRGFSESQGDVVLLNSDVEVVPGWLRRLVFAARSNPQSATVTPLSNNAGAFTAPEPDKEARVPLSLTRDEIGRLIARRSLRLYPTTPTGNGFCMFVRRRALDEIGHFDEAAFPRGYGEENDFCMRALRMGWTHIVDDSTYVFHARSSSFGDEKAALAANARHTIERRYPEYTQLVREFVSSERMEAVRGVIASAFQAAEIQSTIRPRLLTVLHRAGGGTPATNLDLMRALAHRYEIFQLACDTKELILEMLIEGELKLVRTWPLGHRLDPTDITRRDYRNIVGEILRDFDIEVVHIRHLIGHTFDLPSVARVFGIPVILSFHDFYYVCPTVHLLDEKFQFCGGTCTPGQGNCQIPTKWLDRVPHLKHAWVYNWREKVAEMFEHVDSFVTASSSARDVYASAFPQIDERLQIIEHGRDFTVQTEAGAAPPPTDSPVRILVPGNLDAHKGGDLLRAIKDLDTEERLEFHFAGRTRIHYRDLGVQHGEYERNDWLSVVEKIRPSFAGLFSITAETFSHTLSEAWLAGLPVIATDRGALKDRIERDGGGWLIDPDDATRAYQQIRDIVDDVEGFRRQLENLPTSSLRTAAEMGADYENLYKRAEGSTAPFAPVGVRPIQRRPIRLGLFVLGKEGARPASSYVRVLQRYLHPSLGQTIVPVILKAATYLEKPDRIDFDIAVVQRTAVPPELTDRFIEVSKERGIPFLLDLDDDLMNIGPQHADYETFAAWIGPLRRLAASASAVTVSTEPLRESVSEFNSATFIVENQLDEHLWLSPMPPIDSPQVSSIDRRRTRLLYFGSLTHGDDLEILRAATRPLEDDVIVTVIGGAPAGTLEWCEQVVPTRSWNQYPDFVGRLRTWAQNADVALIPLAETDFNRSKSDLKFLEASALGLPVIGSKVAAYAATIQDAQTGLLVGNDPREWTAAIEKLHADSSLRRDLASAALDYVSNERLLMQHVSESEDLLDTLLTESAR